VNGSAPAICPAPEAGEFAAAGGAPCHPELRQTRRCYDLSRAWLFRLPQPRRIDRQPHDTYLKSRDFHSRQDGFRGALPFC
jgi:hypothetical protein